MSIYISWAYGWQPNRHHIKQYNLFFFIKKKAILLLVVKLIEKLLLAVK